MGSHYLGVVCVHFWKKLNKNGKKKYFEEKKASFEQKQKLNKFKKTQKVRLHSADVKNRNRVETPG